MRHNYHATECIIDLIAASGPQELHDLHAECYAQCTTGDYTDGRTFGESFNATNGAVHTLAKAGLLDVEDGSFDLTPYGYVVICTYQTPAFKANAANRI